MNSAGLPNSMEQRLREMNEALLVSSVRQHELAEQAQQAEQAQHASEVRYRRLFLTAQDGILLLDANTGQIIDANPFLSDLLGYAHGDFLGRELWEIGLFRDKSASEAAVRELQEKGRIHYEKLPLETNLGRHIEVEVVANAYWEDDESVIQCNIRDISDRSRLERMTQEQAVALIDLHHRKDEFLAMLSHELRNPMASIGVAVHMLQLLRDGPEMQREAYGILERQVAKLARLVNDLLEISRISTGRIHLQEERVDFREIASYAIEALQPQAGQRRQSIARKLPAEPTWVYADPMRLEQVVVNLLNNACKYTDRNGLIWVELEQQGNEAVLRVRDNGIGIAPEVLPRIFDLFAQADKSLDRSQGGLGIGLALVRSLVTMHGGRVEAHSTLGQGSEFIVTLPVLSAHVPTALPTEIVPATPSARRVLVVDDNLDFAAGLASLMRAAGHDVRLANDGASAMQAALNFLPEVVLLDIGLPVISGYEVAKQLRQEPALKELVLVALTGYGRESDLQRSREAGFDHHLVKPVDFAKVQGILETVSVKTT